MAKIVATVQATRGIYCIKCGRYLGKSYSKGRATCKEYGKQCLPTRREDDSK